MDPYYARNLALKRLWDKVDRLNESAFSGRPTDDQAERARDESQLLALLASGLVPPPLVEELIPFDFQVPEMASACRLLTTHGLDVEAARSAAATPKLAGALEHVRLMAATRSGTGAAWSGQLPFLLWRIWERRHLVAEVEHLISVAEGLATGGDQGEWRETWEAVDREIEGLHTRGLERLTRLDIAPPRALELRPTVRSRLVGDALEPAVVLEDFQVAKTVVDLVRLADRRVMVAVPWIRLDELAHAFVDACIAKAASGVEIVVVTRPVKATRGHARAAGDERELHRRLVTGGVRVSYHARVHDKLFVVDDTVVVGSTNMTKADIRFNRNSAAGIGLPLLVEQFAQRLKALADPQPATPTPRVPNSQIPIFGTGYDGFVHRLDVACETDLAMLEAGVETETTCGMTVRVDSVGYLSSTHKGELCGQCDSD